MRRASIGWNVTSNKDAIATNWPCRSSMSRPNQKGSNVEFERKEELMELTLLSLQFSVAGWDDEVHDEYCGTLVLDSAWSLVLVLVSISFGISRRHQDAAMVLTCGQWKAQCSCTYHC